jgi:hypothetical protein
VRNRFQAFAFKFNLHRYALDHFSVGGASWQQDCDRYQKAKDMVAWVENHVPPAGLYKLNPVGPIALESAQFQPLKVGLGLLLLGRQGQEALERLALVHGGVPLLVDVLRAGF